MLLLVRWCSTPWSIMSRCQFWRCMDRSLAVMLICSNHGNEYACRSSNQPLMSCSNSFMKFRQQQGDAAPKNSWPKRPLIADKPPIQVACKGMFLCRVLEANLSNCTSFNVPKFPVAILQTFSGSRDLSSPSGNRKTAFWHIKAHEHQIKNLLQEKDAQRE